jgi:hypothetical protein
VVVVVVEDHLVVVEEAEEDKIKISSNFSNNYYNFSFNTT